jgi:DNA-binding winged helix-turn-helix (wHTH) protein
MSSCDGEQTRFWGDAMNVGSGATGMQYQGASFIPPSSSLRRYVRFGPFHLDVEQQELFRDGSRVRVQGKVCEALLILINRAGEVVTRETLRARLWPTDSQINYDANVNTTVNKLRQVLGDSPDRPTFVETIPRKGYTFIADVEYVKKAAFADANKGAALTAQESGGRSLEGSQQLIAATGGSRWFTAGMVALLIAGMLFGAAVVLYAHRAV